MQALLTVLAPVIAAIVRALAELFVEKINEPDTASTAERDPDRANRLRLRVLAAKNVPDTAG